MSTISLKSIPECINHFKYICYTSVIHRHICIGKVVKVLHFIADSPFLLMTTVFVLLFAFLFSKITGRQSQLESACCSVCCESIWKVPYQIGPKILDTSNTSNFLVYYSKLKKTYILFLYFFIYL